MNNWEHIWNNRNILDFDNSKTILKYLIESDGFDSPTGRINESDWIDYIHYLKKILNIDVNTSIFEIGMGSGGFLYPFFLNKNKVGGIDFSNSLISIANKFMPNCDFVVNDALKLNIKKKYDIVLSNSVFFYFKNLKYANDILNLMYLKSNKKIAILDVNDLKHKNKAEKIRRGALSLNQYKMKYDNNKHLYYDKNFFIEFAKKVDSKIIIVDQIINNYLPSSYRFNVIIDKTKKFNTNFKI